MDPLIADALNVSTVLEYDQLVETVHRIMFVCGIISVVTKVVSITQEVSEV